MLFGLFPALQASRPNLTEGLKEGERGSSGPRQRLRSVLVVGEVALTLTLLVGAGLLLQSFRRVLQVDTGFNARNLLAMRFPSETATVSKWRTSSSSCSKTSAACPASNRSQCQTDFRLEEMSNHPTFLIEGRPVTEKKAFGQRYSVSPDYFQTMGIALIKGRLFTAEDNRDSPPVIVIDEVLARQYFLNEDPHGKAD